MSDLTSAIETNVAAALAEDVGSGDWTAQLIPSAQRSRARIMGIRMLVVYGLPIGLLLAGAMIEHMGYAITATLYCIMGIAVTAYIAVHWRQTLWRTAQS